MRKKHFFWLGLAFGLMLVIGGSFYFSLYHKSQFAQIQKELLFLQKENKNLQDGVSFIKSSQTEVDFLNHKGWFTPLNRLIAMESIEQLKYLLKDLKSTFEPENITTLKDGYTYRVTKIILEVKSLLDQDVYIFIEELLTSFPGILVPRGFTLTRKEEVYESSTSSFITGELIFEWYALGNFSYE